MVTSSLRKIRSLVRANRNRLFLGRSPPTAFQWRHAGLRWLEASRKYARPMNRNVELPRPKPPWPPTHFITDEMERKTGRRRNKGNYQATSVDVLRTLSKASTQDDNPGYQPAYASMTPVQALGGSSCCYCCGTMTCMGASQTQKHIQTRSGLPSDARSTNLR